MATKKESSFSNFFELRGELDKWHDRLVFALGSVLVLIIWQILCSSGTIPKSVLPSPVSILFAFKELHFENAFVRNMGYTYKLNLLGTIEAIIVGVPVGFILGLFPVCRSMTKRYIDLLRFLPLTALIGMFMCWFGIESNMKVQFLAFSIFVYILPQVITRIDEIDEVYIQTVKTLGASKWQTIKTVFFPLAMGKVFEDIRILSALSWTYIIVAETVNSGQGGIGALAQTFAGKARNDKVFAILITITIIGFIQDAVLIWMGKKLFPWLRTNKGR